MEAHPGTVRFGPYEVRPATRELFRQGLRVKLPPQAFEVLRVLLERRGELVTRQEFHRVLWPADTFVDFDQGLNNAIKRIREVLNDSAESPRYVETLPRLGYRFIGTVDSTQSDAGEPAVENGSVRAPAPPTMIAPGPASDADLKAPAAESQRKPRVRLLLAAAAGMALLVLAWMFRPMYPEPRVTGETPLTTDGIWKWGPLATDGVRVYFTENLNHQETIAAVPISGGQAVPLKTPFAQVGMYGISPDKADLLVAETPDMEHEAPLWRLPVIGGTPRRLGNIVAHDANWSPDGTRLAYVNGGGVYLANGDGSDPRTLLAPRGNANEWAWRPTWSPDGRRLRFEYYDMDTDGSHLWEVNSDGSNPHAVFAASEQNPMRAYGDWTPDGRYYIFSSWTEVESNHPSAAANLWAVRERASLFHRASPLPANLTTGPIRYFVHTLSRDGKTIFALSSLKHGELIRYDPRAKSFSHYASGLSAEGVNFSRDGAWMAYVKYPQGELWRSRADGSEALQLSSRPLFAMAPVWSPDGKRIAFSGVRAGEAWHTYVVSAEGGEPRSIDAIGKGVEPTWSPDGNSLIFVDDTGANGSIGVLDLQTGRIAPIAGSRDFRSPRMSPDGRSIIATSNDGQRLMLFDLRTQAWRELARASRIGWPQWSGDNRFVYFARTDDDPAIFRVPASGGQPEPVASLKNFRTAGVAPDWFALTPGGDVLFLRDTGGGTEIYALSWDSP